MANTVKRRDDEIKHFSKDLELIMEKNIIKIPERKIYSTGLNNSIHMLISQLDISEKSFSELKTN